MQPPFRLVYLLAGLQVGRWSNAELEQLAPDILSAIQKDLERLAKDHPELEEITLMAALDDLLENIDEIIAKRRMD